jgi:DNA-binding IclR family transcriptional regulator
LQRFDVRETIRPFLESLNRDLAETVHLGVLDGSTVRFIDAIESPQASRVSSRLGKSMPAHCTSSGKAMLSYLSADELRRLYPDEALEAIMPNSVRTRTALEAELAKVRRRGFATSNQESENGVSSVAVAFPPSPAPLRMALNVSAPVHRMNREAGRRIADALKAAVTDAAALLH